MIISEKISYNNTKTQRKGKLNLTLLHNSSVNLSFSSISDMFAEERLGFWMLVQAFLLPPLSATT